MTISQGLSHWVVLHWHSMKFWISAKTFSQPFSSALLLPRFLKGLNNGGFEAGKGLSLSAEGSKGGAMTRSWGLRNQRQKLWVCDTERGDSGDSGGGVRRTEASSLGEWRENARLHDRRPLVVTGPSGDWAPAAGSRSEWHCTLSTTDCPPLPPHRPLRAEEDRPTSPAMHYGKL